MRGNYKVGLVHFTDGNGLISSFEDKAKIFNRSDGQGRTSVNEIYLLPYNGVVGSTMQLIQWLAQKLRVREVVPCQGESFLFT